MGAWCSARSPNTTQTRLKAQRLMDANADVAFWHNSKPPLYMTIQQQNNRVFDFLICNFLDLFPMDAYQSVVDYAIDCNRCLLVLQMLQVFPDSLLQESSKTEMSPLARAVESDKLEMVQIILNKLPNAIKHVSKCGNTLLHFAVRFQYERNRVKKRNHNNMLSYILSIIPQSLILMQNKNGHTALHIAVLADDLHAVQMLCEADQSLISVATELFGCTAFAYALRDNHDAIAEYFINVYPDVLNQRSRASDNVLFIQSNANMMQKLLNAKPSLIDELGHQGQTPLHFAVRFCDKNCIAILLAAKPTLIYAQDDYGRTPLQLACELYKLDKVAVFLRCVPNVEFCNKNGTTPLHLAVHCEETDVVTQVLQHNPKFATCKNDCGWTPFHLAIQYFSLSHARVLLPHASIDMIVETNKKELILKHFLLDIQTYLKPLQQSLLRELVTIVYQYLGL